jgi:hypothetical protein
MIIIMLISKHKEINRCLKLIKIFKNCCKKICGDLKWKNLELFKKLLADFYIHLS